MGNNTEAVNVSLFENILNILPPPNSIPGFFLYSFLVYIFIFILGLLCGTGDPPSEEEARKAGKTEKTKTTQTHTEKTKHN
jgi:hypothetical protein